MNEFIVSGSTGFVGRNLTAYFLKNRLGTIQPLNLREPLPDKLDPAKALIHLAGKAHDLKNTSHSQDYFDVNYGLTKDLFDRFLSSDIADFIYFSSVKAVADTVEGILSEDAIPDPQTAYGQSKHKAEVYLLSKELPPSKRLFILRPCMIHGPGNRGNLNLLYKLVKMGIPYPLGAFDNRRSFLSVQNLLFVIERLLSDSSIPGGIYQVADDEPLSTRELMEQIGKASHKNVRIWNLSPNLIRPLARMGDKLKLPLTTERLGKLTENYVVGNKKIKDALGILRLPLSSKEGIFDTIRSFGKINQ